MLSSARWLALLIGLLVLGTGSAYAQMCGTRSVAEDGDDMGGANDCRSTPCLTIQRAVDAVFAGSRPGETVNVAAGKYTEQVTIPISLTLVGAGAANTTINAPATPAGLFDIVTIGQDATVELTGFTVSGPANPIGAGIDVLDGGNGIIHDNTIIAVRNEPLGGAQQGFGIIVGSAGAATATITDNMVVDYQKTGIVVRGTGSTGTITGNIVMGAGATTATAQNGIQVSAGASATVSGNTVSGNECDDAAAGCGPDPETQTQATGILLFESAAGTTVMNNTFTGNDVGIYNLAQGTMLIANQLIRNRFHGIVLDQGDATVDTNTVSGPVVRTDCEGLLAGITLLPGATGNIHDSTITDIRHDPLDSCQVGNGIVAGTVAGAVVTVTIANNTITGYQKTGIVLRGTGSTGTITGNTVTGAGPIDLLAQNGIQVTGASATVRGNTVSGNECNVPSPTGCGADPLTQTQSAGIAFFPAASGSSMTGNTVTGNDVGLYNFALGPTTISGNTLTDNRFEGILLDEGDATVDSNMIDPGNVGIVVISFAESTGDSKGTLTCNGITAATQAGIRLIRDPDSGFTVALTAHSNSIAGNAAGG